ncbi:MAG: hypothetical protein ACRCTP_04605 [Aeromonas popoffii]|uniref:hypothetical protein n=1 Tax=Aeromonas popoffii TaxID=70856 RepID=UPI003F3D17B3
MMISALYPKESIDKIIWTLDAAIDYDVCQYGDVELIRDFITTLSNLKRPDGVVICKPGEYARLTAAEDKLLMLEGYGVDNWEGYDDAMQALENQE